MAVLLDEALATAILGCTIKSKSVLEALSIKLAEKWETPYTLVRGYVNTRMSILIVRATHICQ
jgi:hypothetical protein